MQTTHIHIHTHRYSPMSVVSSSALESTWPVVPRNCYLNAFNARLPCPMSATLLLAAKLLNELGHSVEEVGNETDVGDLCVSYFQDVASAVKLAWKIGASASLLMATMSFESFMPARCWMAPEIPMAM